MNYRLAMPGAPAKPFEKMTKEERALWEPVRAEVVQLIKAQPHLVPRPLLPSRPSPFPPCRRRAHATAMAHHACCRARSTADDGL